MRIRVILSTGLLVALVLSLIPVVAFSAQKITPGGSCKVLNQKVVYLSKTYSCVKSGKKFVWNKGVAIVKSTSTSIPTPAPTPEVKLPNEGTLCTIIGEKVSNSLGTMRCSWAGHSNTAEEAKQRMQWRQFEVIKTSTSRSNNYPRTPVEGATCTSSGDTFDVAGGILECRWIAGKKLQWIKINTVKKIFTNAQSPVSLDICKLQMSASTADRTGRNSGGGMVGFPFVDSDKNGMNLNGTNEVLIVPVDFPDFPGGAGVKQQLEYDKKWLTNWYDYFSNGKSKFNVTTIDSWVRMPLTRSNYPTNSKNIGATSSDSNQRQALQGQPFIDEITKGVDLSKFSTVFIFYPDGEYELGDLIVRNRPFKTKEGVKNLNFFSWGRNLEGMESLKWTYYIHENLHDFNIIGHAPGNGWGLGMMTSTAGIGYSLNPWEAFVLGWMPPEQIYCDDVAKLRPVKLSLSPVEREDRQTKMAIIKISPTKAIVIESHGIDKWSDFKFGDRAFPPGFYAVMAYVVDLDKQEAAPTNADSSSKSNDEWAWAVWQKVDGGPSNQFNKSIGDRKNLGDYVAVLGDSFVIEGVRIKVVGTGDYETIEITKLS